MNGTKPWYQSIGTWGGLTTVIASVLALLKYRVDVQLLNDVRDWVISLMTLIGGAVALYGRLRATKVIAPADSRLADQNFRSNAWLAALLVPAALLIGGCKGFNPLQSPAQSYLDADRATYDAVAPRYAEYSHNDPSIDQAEKDSRDRTLATWKWRIDSASKAPATQPASP